MLTRILIFLIIGIPYILMTGMAKNTDAKPRTENSWQKVVLEIKKDANKAYQETHLSKQILKKERAYLIKKMSSLKKKTTFQEKKLERRRKQFNKMLESEEILKREIASENQELKTVEGTIRASSKEADLLVLDSFLNIDYPNRGQIAKKLLQPDHFPDFSEIVDLIGLYFQEIELSGTIKKSVGDFISPAGGVTKGEIIRIGTFTAFYKAKPEKMGWFTWLINYPHAEKEGTEKSSYVASILGKIGLTTVLNYFPKPGNVGFLKADSNSKRLIAIPGKLPADIKNTLIDYYDEDTIIAPLDISRGAAFILLSQKKDLKETVLSGGVMAWIILFVGCAALIIGLERLINLVWIRTANDKTFNEIHELVKIGDIKKSRELCEKRKKTPTFRVINSILFFSNSKKEVLENACEEAIMREMPRLERFLSTLGVLAAIAPLLGLLGTVTGMINTFQVISTFGTGDPKMMSGGISEALITTQLGLAVAIPIMLYHHFLERRVDKILGNIEEKSAAVVISLMDQNNPIEGDIQENVA